jgi:hypothetical protein
MITKFRKKKLLIKNYSLLLYKKDMKNSRKNTLKDEDIDLHFEETQHSWCREGITTKNCATAEKNSKFAVVLPTFAQVDTWNATSLRAVVEDITFEESIFSLS